MAALKVVVRILATSLLGVVGTVIAFAGIQVSRMEPGYTEFQQKVAKRENLEMKPAPINPSWMISGSADCLSAVFSRELDSSSPVGIWECRGPAKFNWHYAADESIYVLSGEAEIEYLGKKFALVAGDSAHFSAGTTATWTVPAHVRKTFRILEHGFIKRSLRWLGA